MDRKLSLAVVASLFIYCHHALGQTDSIPADRIVSITPADPEKKFQKTVQGKSVNVITTAAYIELAFRDFDMFTYRLNNQEYDPQLATVTAQARRIDTLPSRAYNIKTLYLSPGERLSFDVYEKPTGGLVNRYIISRPRIVPVLSFFRSNDKTPFYSLPTNGRAEWLSMKPGELSVRINDGGSDINRLNVDYVLRNQTTGSWTSGNTRYNFRLNLDPNTVYELRYNFTDQPESMRTYTMFVKPYWYNSKRFYAILIAIVLASGIGWLAWYYRNRLRLSTGKQEKLEQAAIRLQSLLNPHFTFNALSSIQGLMNTNRIDEANHYLQEFSGLLRKTLAKSQNVFNSLDQELEMMRMYLHLEALRFNFSWDIELSDELDLTAIEIPTLILQPLIENAIKHGLSGLGDKGKLEIVCKHAQQKDSFVLVVKDNGTWVDKPTESGYGLSLTNERIVTINKLKKDQYITLEFDKRWGTAAILTFHNWIES